MLISDAITKVRSATLHDDDTQFTDTQLIDVLADEYRRLRKWMCSYIPSLCEAVVSGIAVDSTGVILKSALAGFERIRRVERQVSGGVVYFPIDVASGLAADYPYRVSVREQPLQLLVSPGSLAPGTYQVVYLTGAPASIVASTVVDMPDELCGVMVERACVWARQRHNEREAMSYHEKRAAELMADAYSLRSRYGDHGKPGLKRERSWR
jgi:hypothetical protein